MLVRAISLEDHEVRLEVRRSLASTHFDALVRYVEVCQKQRFPRVYVHYKKSLSKGTMTMLGDLEKRYDSVKVTPLPNKRDPAPRATDATYEFHCGTPKSGKEPVVYTLRFRHLQTALDQINTFALLVGSSTPLDERRVNHLQLCLYELTANTMEHATFTTTSPEIQITLTVHPDSVEVLYRDNSEPFQSILVPSEFIEHRINAGAKRGLGLFLLQQICDTFDHARESGWNHTSFSMKYDIQRQEA